jgi:hypothetical protein
MSIIKEFFNYIFYSNDSKSEKTGFLRCLKNILYLLLFNLLFLIIVTLIKTILINKGYIQPLQGNFSISKISIFLIVYKIFVNPLIEELLFRLWLNFNTLNFSISLISLILVILIRHFYKENINTVYLIISLEFITITFFTFYYLSKKFLMPLFQKLNLYKRNMVVISGIVFGLMHLIKFVITTELLFFSPLILAPLIMLGLIIGYIRIKFGFFYGYVTHFIQNLIPNLLQLF